MAFTVAVCFQNKQRPPRAFLTTTLHCLLTVHLAKCEKKTKYQRRCFKSFRQQIFENKWWRNTSMDKTTILTSISSVASESVVKFFFVSRRCLYYTESRFSEWAAQCPLRQKLSKWIFLYRLLNYVMSECLYKRIMSYSVTFLTEIMTHFLLAFCEAERDFNLFQQSRKIWDYFVLRSLIMNSTFQSKHHSIQSQLGRFLTCPKPWFSGIF